MFAMSALRLLGCDIASLQPRRHVPPIERDAPLPADEFGDPAGGPEVGRIPETLGALAEPCQDDDFLPEVQFPRACGWCFRPDAVIAVFAICGLPSIYNPRGDAEERGDVGDGVAVADALDGELSPPFEFGGRAVWSHAR